MKYSPYVSPCNYQGEKSVFVNGKLYDLEPLAYKFMGNFARDNNLQLIEGCEAPHE